jgi:hypothetical protein
MEKSIFRSHLAIALTLGSVWGTSEVILGAGIQACAHTVSGSLMTGIALFFIAAAWAATKNYHIPVLVVLIACLFKLFDAVLLSLPVLHGAIGNPIFAFLLEGFAILLLVAVFRKQRWQKRSSRAFLGAGAALIAVAMFPLVRYATGIPACVYPGTAVPLSIFFAPVAILFSAFTVPVGFVAGERIRKVSEMGARGYGLKLTGNIVSPLTLVICIALVTLFRWMVTSGAS